MENYFILFEVLTHPNNNYRKFLVDFRTKENYRSWKNFDFAEQRVTVGALLGEEFLSRIISLKKVKVLKERKVDIIASDITDFKIETSLEGKTTMEILEYGETVCKIVI